MNLNVGKVLFYLKNILESVIVKRSPKILMDYIFSRKYL